MRSMETMERPSVPGARARALSAITAPPFIGNVVASLVGLNRAGERERLNDALVHFGKLFPYLSEPSPEAALPEELRFVEHYLRILEMRHGKRFGFRIGVESDTAGIRRFGLFEAVEALARTGLRDGTGAVRISIESGSARGGGRPSSIRVRMTGEGIPSAETVLRLRSS